VDDLAEALVIAGSHPAAPGRTLIAAHPQPVSTTRLVESIRRALGRPRRLVAVPPALLEAAAGVVGWGERMRRLTRSLEVDSCVLVGELGWVPHVGLDEGIAASVSGGNGPGIR
jgi:nucleoside-diphosphate-sugar epimerase